MTEGDATLLRVGFVGAGRHATGAIYPSLRHAPVDLVAIADLDRELAERNVRWFGGGEVYADHRELLAQADVDAVFVVGPPGMHHAVGMDVLTAGKHLFIEKPPADNLDQALELRDAAQQAGVQLMVGFMKRFASGYARAAEIAATSDFGQARLLRMDYAHWVRDDLHFHVIDMCVHPLDLARYFLGDVIGGSVTRREHPDGRVLIVELDHARGGTSQLNLSSCAPSVKESVDLYGASQVIQVRNLTELRHYHKSRAIEPLPTESMASLWHPEFTIPWRDTESLVLQGYAGEVHHFAERILAGKPVDSSIGDGIEALRIAHAIEHAPEGRSALLLPSVY